MVSCQKDDEQFLVVDEVEVLMDTELSQKKATSGTGVVKSCRYIPLKVTINAGGYSGCDLFQKMIEKRDELSSKIDGETGCPMYNIPNITYFQCSLMNSATYTEHWQKLSNCGGKNWCPGSDTLDLDLDTDLH